MNDESEKAPDDAVETPADVTAPESTDESSDASTDVTPDEPAADELVAEEPADEATSDEPVEEPTAQKPVAALQPVWRRALTGVLAFVLTLFCAWAGNVVLDYSTWRPTGTPPLAKLLHPAGLLPSLLIVWIVVILVVALLGRLWTAMGVLAVMAVLIAAVNATKVSLRNDPVYPSDVAYLKQAGFLTEMVPGSKLVIGLVVAVFVIIGAWLFGRLAARVFPPLARGLSKRTTWIVRGSRVLVVAICLALLVSTGGFNKPGNHWRGIFESTGLRWRVWDDTANYKKNGFVAGLLFNMPVTAMTKPADYSEATMRALVSKYTEQARALNATRSESLDKTNVIVVLSESFSDPTWLKTVTYPTDPIPNTRALMAQTLSGKMLAPGYGGGTANVEFEVLTGQSLSQFAPQLSSPYEQLVHDYRDYPSAVGYFARNGHDPIAIHPFSPKMYDRPEVYKTFGFNAFIDRDSMSEKSKLEDGRFISDRAAFDEAARQIDESAKPLFVNLITMQNHMPYGGQYTSSIKPTGLPKKNAGLAGQYAQGINFTDGELKDFLDKLKADPEPTTVIFYGDHLPAQIYPGNLERREGLRTIHETPFLIWNNKKPLAHTELPTTSPTQFLPLMFQAMNVPIPPMYALLQELYGQLPAMDTGMNIDAQNKLVRFKNLSPEAAKVLADYRMFQYDLSIGKRYSESAMFGTPPTPVITKAQTRPAQTKPAQTPSEKTLQTR